GGGSHVPALGPRRAADPGPAAAVLRRPAGAGRAVLAPRSFPAPGAADRRPAAGARSGPARRRPDHDPPPRAAPRAPPARAAALASGPRRGRRRRRVAALRAAGELLLRDLGGLVYETPRTAGDHEHEAHRRLRATKLDRLSRVDSELHELELQLDDVRRN